MSNSVTVPVRVYKEFMTRDWPTLPRGVQDALASVVTALQKNPDDPALVTAAERDSSGRLGYEFSPGYVMYWRVARDDYSNPLTPTHIEVLAVIKTGIEFSEAGGATSGSEHSVPETTDILQRVYSRNASMGNLSMWASLHTSQRTGKIRGWIVNSWSTGGSPFLHPKMHWVSYPDYQFHHMGLKIDFNSSIGVGPVDNDIEPSRLFFVRTTLRQWEQDWIEEQAGVLPKA